ncbi:ATP-binding cassette domain-containing protein [Clostridium botulinum]|uniref:ABC transporter ATP-binding protein n=1 Tax=Clostridium botulinum C/D str. DC5 TaxID=1443128 RepID=A0A0A0III9_CLOBO|nr:ATP-binding cassette domain-containing protein [Clostridium botulinum]KGN00429.1 ABC transporter ATP-binding protein [Clostridium botulinum C/D str. DC5]KOC52790.1 ABC transporter ATP-binding protein [Clostridium botulinum]KOC58224.1 ABC transporter ATP-binding protein [Clostridium botulinum]MCD3233569.1 ATP-binding cassette domain-containing protein [Clostridium botulinum D/C]MCD3239319.1 ATP-binding cassette domain-containing protein [Clostridium botulinum D/C]
MGLKLVNVTKSYGENVILDNINLELENGIYGLLGANGVGKTTLFKVISGFLTDYKGKVAYPKLNDKNETLLGFLPQSFTGYPEMAVQEFLKYIGGIKANASQHIINKEIDEKLELFGLTDFKSKKLKTLSGGQLRRVGLAQAFLLNPKIVMLDEPTTGLDPTERIRFKNYISEFGREQTILVSTHIVSDLEFISKEIFILKDGNFVMKGTEKQLVQRCNNLVWEASFKNEMELHNRLKDYTISMIYDDGGITKARVISEKPPVPNSINVVPTLNDIYLFNFKKEAQSNAK